MLKKMSYYQPRKKCEHYLIQNCFCQKCGALYKSNVIVIFYRY